MLEKFEEAGNPFSDTSKDLYALDSKIVMSSSVKHSIEIAEQTGKTQLETFVSQRLSHSATIPFFNPIAKNNFPLFSSSSEKVSDKTRTRISNLNSDVNLFSRLYIASETREVDINNFFTHENHAWPPISCY